MIFCLGLFLVPKESLWSKTSLENCCTSTEMSDCCKTDGNSTHDKSKDGKHCDDDCCSTCVSCFHVIASVDHKNSFIDIALDWVMLFIFCGLTIYDMNKIKVMGQEIEGDSEKLYIYGAMQLYLDFINMFIRILSLFGRRRD